MIPLVHDFTDTTVLIFGGGAVGARKARRFAREARVIVVSPAFDGDAFGDAALVRAAPAPESIAAWLDCVAPALVVAATDDEPVNDAVETAANERGILYNRADKSGSRDHRSVVVPATVRDDPVVVSVSTDASSPVLSKHLRQELEESLDGAGTMARMLAELRTELTQRGVNADRRREILTEVVNRPSVWTVLRSGTANTRQVIDDVLAETLSSDGDST